MVAIGFGVAFAGYTLMYVGYVWVRGYNLSFKQIVSPTAYYSGKWPPPQNIPSTSVFPTGTGS